MGQANANAAAPLNNVAAQLTDNEAAFVAAIETLEAAHAANAKAKGDNKPLADAVKVAERVAAWAAFDCVNACNDAQAASELGEAFARTIADAKGLGDASTATYAMRGRMLYQYRTAIAKEGETRVLTKGANKGDTVNGRDKAQPLSVVRRLYETAQSNKAQREAVTPYLAEADTLAAKALGLSEPDFAYNLTQPGDEGTEAREARDKAVERVKARRNALNTLRETLAMLETDEAKAEAVQIMVQALDVKLAD